MTLKIRNVVAVLGSVAVIAAALVPGVAQAAKPKPVQTKLYLHGTSPIGESDSFPVVADAFLPMDAKEPTGTEPKSKAITNGIGTPNYQCAGNTLFPVWTGPLVGRVKGDMKVTFHSIGSPGQVEVRVWPDVMSQMCTSETTGATDYVEPAGSVVVDLPPGQGSVEAVIKGVDFEATAMLMVQISPIVVADLPSPLGAVLSPNFARVLYDTPDFASGLEFTCIPAKGKTSCTP